MVSPGHNGNLGFAAIWAERQDGEETEDAIHGTDYSRLRGDA